MNDSVVRYLKYYVGLKDPKYAILLNGNWGSGKTWFINDFIENQINSKKFVFVSLYGVNSLSEIEDLIFQELHPVLGSKKFRLAGRLLKGLLKATIRFDVDDDKTVSGTLNPNVSDVELPGYLSNLEEKVLVFDDLERTSIELHLLMGYLNQFVERLGCKLILIANEKELLDQSNLKNNEANIKNYRLVKEKLVGRTFLISTDVQAAASRFIADLNEGQAKGVLKSNQDLLKKIYHSSKYNNLRFLRQSILDFGRFYTYLSSELIEGRDSLIEHILSLFFALSIELRQGALRIEDLLGFNFSRVLVLHTQYTPDSDKNISKILLKYQVFTNPRLPFSITSLAEFFQSGEVDKEALQKSMMESVYFAGSEIPDWRKLLAFIELEDEEFKVISHSVINSLKKGDLIGKESIVQSVGVLIKLAQDNLIDEEKNEIIEWGKNSIKLLREKGQLKTKSKSKLLKYSSHGVQYQSLEDQDFIKFLAFLDDQINQEKIDSLGEITQYLLDTLKKSPDLFGDIVSLNNIDREEYRELPIQMYLPAEQFFDTFIKYVSNKGKRDLGYHFEQRYDHVIHLEFLKEERAWIDLLIKKIDDYVDNHEKAISALILRYQLKPVLQRALDKIQ